MQKVYVCILYFNEEFLEANQKTYKGLQHSKDYPSLTPFPTSPEATSV